MDITILKLELNVNGEHCVIEKKQSEAYQKMSLAEEDFYMFKAALITNRRMSMVKPPICCKPDIRKELNKCSQADYCSPMWVAALKSELLDGSNEKI